MSTPRLIEPGSCSWCGHKPHAETCPCTIQTAPAGRIKASLPCPCTQHLLAPVSVDLGFASFAVTAVTA